MSDVTTADPKVTFCRDYDGTTEAPGTIRADGRPVGLWWSEAAGGAPSSPWFSALCAFCEEVVSTSHKLRTVRASFALHLRAVHVEGMTGPAPSNTQPEETPMNTCAAHGDAHYWDDERIHAGTVYQRCACGAGRTFSEDPDDQPETPMVEQKVSATGGAWARDIARTYDRLAEDFESRPDTPENRLGAIANRAEAAKYHDIAARMDAASPRPAALDHEYHGNRSMDTCWHKVAGGICGRPIEDHPQPTVQDPR